MSGAATGTSAVTVWVTLELNKTTLGMNKLVDVPLTSDVADVRTSVKSLFPNRLSRFDPSDIDLFLSSKEGVKESPPVRIGDVLEPDKMLESEVLNRLSPTGTGVSVPASLFLLAVVEGGAWRVRGGRAGRRARALTLPCSFFSVPRAAYAGETTGGLGGDGLVLEGFWACGWKCRRLHLYPHPSVFADLVAVVGAISSKVDAALAQNAAAASPLPFSDASCMDLFRAFSRYRLIPVAVRFGTLFGGMAAPDVAVSADVPPFDWSPYRAAGGGAREAEETASPALLTHFANQLLHLVPVRVEDARDLNLKYLRRSSSRRRIIFQGHVDALVVTERATPESASAALLAVDWTCSTNFVDAGQLTQQRTKVQMEMLALSRLTGRFVPGVLTDLTTGMRVWDVVGSVIVEWKGSAANGALTLCEGFGLLRRILLREIAVTDALFVQGSDDE